MTSLRMNSAAPFAGIMAMATLLPLAVSAAQPKLDDFAKGVIIDAPASTLPLIETTLPDVVYQTITRADLGDLRVFNAEGAPVPHAICAAPEAAEPVITTQPLPVFELREGQRRSADGSRIEIETPAGTHVNVGEPVTGGTAAANGRTHIIDVRQATQALRAIVFDWESPDGASQATVRIESSDDLNRWSLVVPASTLLVATRGEQQGAQQLKRERIELPVQQYTYLRIERADGGPPLVLKSAVAELMSAAVEIEPLWFMPVVSGASGTSRETAGENTLLFDTARIAPVRYARLRLPQANSSVRVSLQSRPNDKSSWLDRWGGEMYVITTDTARRESPPARFDPTTDRQWRVVMPALTSAATSTLELAYRPARLRFMAQGSGPYTIAFGSRRVEILPPTACDGLLADVSAEERAQLIGEGYAGRLLALGGDSAYKPLPKKTPLRLIVLWSVLIVGVGLLVTMAVALLKRVRPPQ